MKIDDVYILDDAVDDLEQGKSFKVPLINQKNLQTIGNAVPYIDKITEESIPSLPISTFVFNRIATPMPLKIKTDELTDNQKSDSHTLKFETITEETP